MNKNLILTSCVLAVMNSFSCYASEIMESRSGTVTETLSAVPESIIEDSSRLTDVRPAENTVPIVGDLLETLEVNALLAPTELGRPAPEVDSGTLSILEERGLFQDCIQVSTEERERRRTAFVPTKGKNANGSHSNTQDFSRLKQLDRAKMGAQLTASEPSANVTHRERRLVAFVPTKGKNASDRRSNTSDFSRIKGLNRAELGEQLIASESVAKVTHRAQQQNSRTSNSHDQTRVSKNQGSGLFSSGSGPNSRHRTRR